VVELPPLHQLLEALAIGLTHAGFLTFNQSRLGHDDWGDYGASRRCPRCRVRSRPSATCRIVEALGQTKWLSCPSHVTLRECRVGSPRTLRRLELRCTARTLAHRCTGSTNPPFAGVYLVGVLRISYSQGLYCWDRWMIESSVIWT